MVKRTEFTHMYPMHGARIHFLLDIEKGKVIHFVINLVLVLDDGTRHEVYRADTCHGFAHEQRFWQIDKKIMLEGNYTGIFREKKNVLLENYSRWISLFREKRRL